MGQDSLPQLATAWAAQGYPHAQPATPEQLAAFESQHGLRLPADLRNYFLTLNGGELGREGSMDDANISFWRLDQVRTQVEEGTGQRADLFLFADFLLDSHLYGIELHAEPESPTPVFLDDGGTLHKVADSFSTFIRGYLSADEHILFGKRPSSGPSA